MKQSTYHDLKKLLGDFAEKRDALQLQIQDNELHIREAQVYTRKILDREQEDFDVFSPRRTKGMYKSELEQFHMKQADYEETGLQLTQEREKLDLIIDVLKRVAEESDVEENDNDIEENDIEQRVEEDEERKDGSWDGSRENPESLASILKHLNHKIKVSAGFIRQDPFRAKAELVRVMEDLQDIILNLQ